MVYRTLVLRLVEIKGKDLFTIYDVENGGVCCCSKYTLEQLVKEYKQPVDGVMLKDDGTLQIIELNLDGAVRIRKSSIICENETKCSAEAILKGLDAKHYPRVKRERRTIGSIVELTIHHKESIVNDVVCKAIQVANNVFLTMNGLIFEQRNDKDYILTIKSSNGSDDEVKLLNSLRDLYDKSCDVEKMRTAVDNDVKRRMAYLEKEKQRIEEWRLSQYNSLDKRSILLYQEQKFLVNQYKYKGVTGEELCKYSFVGNNTVDIDYMRVLIERTSRSFIHTDGLIDRHPVTRGRRISKQEAINIVNGASYLSIDATDKNVIYINTVNDGDIF